MISQTFILGIPTTTTPENETLAMENPPWPISKEYHLHSRSMETSQPRVVGPAAPSNGEIVAFFHASFGSSWWFGRRFSRAAEIKTEQWEGPFWSWLSGGGVWRLNNPFKRLDSKIKSCSRGQKSCWMVILLFCLWNEILFYWLITFWVLVVERPHVKTGSIDSWATTQGKSVAPEVVTFQALNALRSLHSSQKKSETFSNHLHLKPQVMAAAGVCNLASQCKVNSFRCCGPWGNHFETAQLTGVEVVLVAPVVLMAPVGRALWHLNIGRWLEKVPMKSRVLLTRFWTMEHRKYTKRIGEYRHDMAWPALALCPQLRPMTGKGAYERVTSLKYVGEGHGSINKDGRGGVSGSHSQRWGSVSWGSLTPMSSK